MMLGVGRSVAAESVTSGLSRARSGVVKTTAYRSVGGWRSAGNGVPVESQPACTMIESRKEILYERSENEIKQKIQVHVVQCTS